MSVPTSSTTAPAARGLGEGAVRAPRGPELPFTIQEGRRRNLLLGLDEIGQTLAHDADIERFQAADRVRRPWIYPERVRARPGSARA